MGVSVADAWPKTGISCSASFCEEGIEYVEEIFALSVEVAAYTEYGELIYTPIVASDGDYLYEPVFYCHGCWKSILDELDSFVADTPPVEDDHSILRCAVCKSGIRVGEVLARVVAGELHAPKRSPDGTTAPTFIHLTSTPLVLCAPCVNIIDQDVSEIWGDPLRQNNECAEGTYMRCWRHGCGADVDCGCISED